MTPDQIIITPLMSEKSNLQREGHKFCFRVHPRANKIEIMRAIQSLFDVHPISCNVITMPRSPRRVRYRKIGYTSPWKKAIITVPKNETIAIFEGA